MASAVVTPSGRCSEYPAITVEALRSELRPPVLPHSVALSEGRKQEEFELARIHCLIWQRVGPWPLPKRPRDPPLVERREPELRRPRAPRPSATTEPAHLLPDGNPFLPWPSASAHRRHVCPSSSIHALTLRLAMAPSQIRWRSESLEKLPVVKSPRMNVSQQSVGSRRLRTISQALHGAAQS